MITIHRRPWATLDMPFNYSIFVDDLKAMDIEKRNAALAVIIGMSPVIVVQTHDHKEAEHIWIDKYCKPVEDIIKDIATKVVFNKTFVYHGAKKIFLQRHKFRMCDIRTFSAYRPPALFDADSIIWINVWTKLTKECSESIVTIQPQSYEFYNKLIKLYDKNWTKEVTLQPKEVTQKVIDKLLGYQWFIGNHNCKPSIESLREVLINTASKLVFTHQITNNEMGEWLPDDYIKVIFSTYYVIDIDRDILNKIVDGQRVVLDNEKTVDYFDNLNAVAHSLEQLYQEHGLEYLDQDYALENEISEKLISFIVQHLDKIILFILGASSAMWISSKFKRKPIEILPIEQVHIRKLTSDAVSKSSNGKLSDDDYLKTKLEQLKSDTKKTESQIKLMEKNLPLLMKNSDNIVGNAILKLKPGYTRQDIVKTLVAHDVVIDVAMDNINSLINKLSNRVKSISGNTDDLYDNDCINIVTKSNIALYPYMIEKLHHDVKFHGGFLPIESHLYKQIKDESPTVTIEHDSNKPAFAAVTSDGQNATKQIYSPLYKSKETIGAASNDLYDEIIKLYNHDTANPSVYKFDKNKVEKKREKIRKDSDDLVRKIAKLDNKPDLSGLKLMIDGLDAAIKSKADVMTLSQFYAEVIKECYSFLLAFSKQQQ